MPTAVYIMESHVDISVEYPRERCRIATPNWPLDRLESSRGNLRGGEGGLGAEDLSLVLRLATGQWIKDGQTVLVTGVPGSGKSYLACALGHQACRLGISTRYYRVSRLLDELIARGDGSYPKLIQRPARTWLLILDAWGLASLSGHGRHHLLEVLVERYARRGTLLASQVLVEHWHDLGADPTFDDAILDRLLNNAHRITLKGASPEETLRLDEERLHPLTPPLTPNPQVLLWTSPPPR